MRWDSLQRGPWATGWAQRTRAERFQVVVHVTADTVAAADPADPSSAAAESQIEHGPIVSAETCRRLACDAGRVIMTHAPDGSVLDVGRRTRTIPPAIRRALQHRDGGCRFPGCTNRFWDGHHIVHWEDGGKTKLSNLVSVCRFHHRAVHEGGFNVQIMADGGLRFTDPGGRPIEHVPVPPPAPEEPVAALKQTHGEAGIEIGPWTATPIWHGEPLDLGYAVMVLRQPLRQSARPQPDVSAETCREEEERSQAHETLESREAPCRSSAFGSSATPVDWITARYSEFSWHR